MALLQVAEIATLICNFSGTSDCARLSRVSHLLFDVTVPFIWEHVDGAKNLIALLAPIYESPSAKKIILKEKASKPDAFSRFDFYAPHVKSLDVYGHKKSSLSIDGWPVLISRAQQRPLLPNLEKLIIKAGNHPDGANQPFWMAAFASPTLTVLSIHPPTYSPLSPIIPHRAAAFIMHFLMRSRPKLKRLDLFPSREADKHIGDGGTILRPYLSGKTLEFYQYLAGSTTLTHLSGTFAWFEKKVVLILARLPNLESISIYLDEDDTGPYVDLNSLLSDDSFPALRELTLDRAHIFQALRVMRAERLVGRLTTLRLGIEDETFGFNNIYGVWETEDYRFQDLFAKVTRLNHLEVTVYEPDVLLPFDQHILWQLLELPIQTMKLHGIRLDDVELVTEEIDVAWPNLIDLRIPDYPVTLYDTSDFAQMSGLRFLEVQLDLRNPKEWTLFRELQPIKSLEVIKSSAGGHMCSTAEEMDFVARTLLEHWPELKRIEWDTTDVATIERARQLNDQIKLVRKANTSLGSGSQQA
ncbi:hypothetical protein FRC12_003762 [Ceratobasidium sp. 428]|nr:hypothetical protein FRC12_003762 [Ceratobasidium sp. 428]